MAAPGEFDQAIVVYTSDTGEVFTISQRRSNALAVNNPITAVRSRQGIPEFWNLRFIRAQTISGSPPRTYQRKIVIADANNPLFTGQIRFVVLDGTTWLITGCKGERMRGPRSQ